MTTAQLIVTILVAIIGSTGLASLIQFLIQRKDNKKGLLETINKKLDALTLDSCRTQLLLLLSDYPNNEHEILILAQRYFVQLEGDWYLSSLFEEWCRRQGVHIPLWYKSCVR